MRITSLALWSVLIGSCSAFVPPQQLQQMQRASTTSSSLNAVAPTFIIGPMIKKMRGEKEQKGPMLDAKELKATKAPGLRVGTGAWKWPPVWPYDDETFLPKDDIPEPKGPDLAAMAQGMANPQMQGMPPPVAAEVEEVDESKKLNREEYWGSEVADVTTDLTAEAAANLRNHYSFFLEDGMSVLELGAAEESYLPADLKLGRHVGVGLSQKLMDANAALDERYIVDLNIVEEEAGVKSDVLSKLAAEQDGEGLFDVILMANTVDFLTNPREVYKTAWHLLKPGGLMIVPFSNKEFYEKKFGRAQTKMWKDYNDDQHMWVCGSLFHFSAGDGWESLRGFDISPEGAKNVEDQEGPFSFLKAGENTNLYVVQATRAIQDDDIDNSNPEKSFQSKMWMLPTMENRDKLLVAPRLRRTYEQLPQGVGDYLSAQVNYLPAVYESLIKMDQFAFTFNMQAQLATDLVSDPDFNANDEQLMALKQGLGLRTPSEEFWAPIGKLTGAMDVEDKINLLAHIVPRFGSNDKAQEAALAAFCDGLEPTYNHVRSVCPCLSEAQVQVLGTELLASEILKPNRSTRAEFAKWLAALTESELTQILESRLAVKTNATEELKQFRAEQAEKLKTREALTLKMEQQMKDATASRTLEFNPRTGKFDKKEKK